MSDIKSVG